jgi:hypothetical protein
MQEVDERTDGEVKLHAGTLYATLKKLLASGLIREVGERADEEGDTRRRYYRITAYGRTRHKPRPSASRHWSVRRVPRVCCWVPHNEQRIAAIAYIGVPAAPVLLPAYFPR